MDCSPPGSSIHGIFQARVLEWGAITFSVLSLSRESPLNSTVSLNSQRLPEKLPEVTGTFFGEGNGTPLQYSCLENPMDGGAWWAAGHAVARLFYDLLPSWDVSLAFSSFAGAS